MKRRFPKRKGAEQQPAVFQKEEQPEGKLLSAFADLVRQRLFSLLSTSSGVRDVQRQWKTSFQALLPLVIFGHEEDPQGLWTRVGQLDRRFKNYPDPAEDEALSMRRLESALDVCSAQIIELVQAQVAAICPAAELARGLCDGYWCVYALLPRGGWKPPEKPRQLTLF